MTVTATFPQGPFALVPGTPATFTLRLHNSAPVSHSLEMRPTGPLAVYTTLERPATEIGSNEFVDAVLRLEVPATFEAGFQDLTVEIRTRDLDDVGAASVDDATPPATATATTGTTTATTSVEVAENPAYTIELHPPRSRHSSTGRHQVKVVNSGNIGVVVEIAPDAEDDPTIEFDTPVPVLTAAPGVTDAVDVRVTAASRFWTGPVRIHDFVIHTSASDGSTDELAGAFEQGPRIPSWVGPALAGALIALLLGTIAWFAWLAPWVETTADDAAAEAIERDRAALQERIDELEAAAAEAEELPLGTPTDLTLSVEPTGGSSASDSAPIAAGETLSVTDLIFQNPTGAVGTASLLRDDDVLLTLELANFRDFDLHLVAPYTFGPSSEITLRVDCRTPGTDGSGCPVNLSVVGFVDESDR